MGSTCGQGIISCHTTHTPSLGPKFDPRPDAHVTRLLGPWYIPTCSRKGTKADSIPRLPPGFGLDLGLHLVLPCPARRFVVFDSSRRSAPEPPSHVLNQRLEAPGGEHWVVRDPKGASPLDVFLDSNFSRPYFGCLLDWVVTRTLGFQGFTGWMGLIAAHLLGSWNGLVLEAI